MVNEYSIIDKVQKNYDSSILDDNNKVHPYIRKKILFLVYNIAKYLELDINRIWIIGSSITKQYTETSDIDINIFLDKKFEETRQKDIDVAVNNFFNEKFFVNNHPINFKFISEYNNERTDAIYDLVQNVWIQKPKELLNSDLENIIKKCKKTKNFIQAINDYETLSTAIYEYATTKQLTETTKNKLEKIIIDSINNLIKDFKKVTNVRRSIFKNKSLSKKINSANYRCSNIVYKLLESYGIKNIVHVLNEHIEYLTPEEFKEKIQQIRNEN